MTAITLVGLLVRLPGFGSSLFGDELGAYWTVTGHSLGRVVYLMSNHSAELNPPLFFIVAWGSERIFGATAESMKLVSLLAGTAAIPLTYLLGRWTLGRSVGAVGSALIALSPFLIFYSTEARPYALMMLLCLLATLALLKATRSSARRWWAAYAISACAAVYTHFVAVFLLAGLFGWGMIFAPRFRKRLVVASAAAAVGFVPWVPSLIATSKSPGARLYGQLDPPTLHFLRIDLGHWAFGHPYLPLATLPGHAAEELLVAGMVCAVVGLGVGAWRERTRMFELDRSQLASWALVVILATAAPVGAAAYSRIGTSVWGARQLVASWSGFALLLAAFLWSAGRLRLIATALVVGAFAAGGVKMTETAYQRPDYRGVVSSMDRLSKTAPAVDLPSVTPGPPTELEAALSLSGSASRHQVIRIGLPLLSAVLRAPPYASLPVQSGEAIAQEAARRAGNGPLFLVGPTDLTIAQVNALRRQKIRGGSGELGIFASFLGALPGRFQLTRMRAFPGFVRVSLYEFSNKSASAGRPPR